MVTLRRAEERDRDLIFGWRNHPRVREYFFDPREISHAEHCEWFDKSLRREDRIILLAFDEERPVGVIRFDLEETDEGTAEVDIYVDPELQGKGLGGKILSEGENWVRENTRIDTLLARVRQENRPSVRMFSGCGFVSKFIQFRKSLRSSGKSLGHVDGSHEKY